MHRTDVNTKFSETPSTVKFPRKLSASRARRNATATQNAEAFRAEECKRLTSRYIVPANTTPDYAIVSFAASPFPPVIDAMDLAAIDTTTTEFDGDGLYIIAFFEGPAWIAVRRLQHIGGSFFMSEDVSGMPPMEVTPTIAVNFQIVAKIIHVYKLARHRNTQDPRKIPLFGSRELVRDDDGRNWVLSSSISTERLSDRESMFINAALKATEVQL